MRDFVQCRKLEAKFRHLAVGDPTGCTLKWLSDQRTIERLGVIFAVSRMASAAFSPIM
jgi:hypothetical protein